MRQETPSSAAEVFRNELKSKVEIYAEARWERNKTAEEQHMSELLELCVETLLNPANQEEQIMNEIHRHFLWHHYGNGYDMLGLGGRQVIMTKLVIALAQKAKNQPKEDNITNRDKVQEVLG